VHCFQSEPDWLAKIYYLNCELPVLPKTHLTEMGPNKHLMHAAHHVQRKVGKYCLTVITILWKGKFKFLAFLL